MLNPVSVIGGSGYYATATFTPAAAAYSANDVISVAQTLTWKDRDGNLFPGGELMITSSRLLVNATAVISGETSYNLHLYNVTPTSPHADNDAWDEPDAQIAQYQGPIALGTPVDIGSQLEVFTDGINRQITVLSTGKSFAELATVGGFTATAKARTVYLHGVVM